MIDFILLDTGDLDQLQLISKTTFSDAFEKENTPENFKAYMEAAFTLESLSDELVNPNSQFYFVEYDRETVGYFKINFGDAQTEVIASNGMELHRIYVLAGHQGKKIGDAIMSKVLELAQAENVDFIWLGVWDRNKRAVKFYERNGFKIIDSHVFMMGSEEQNDYIMRKDLKS